MNNLQHEISRLTNLLDYTKAERDAEIVKNNNLEHELSSVKRQLQVYEDARSRAYDAYVTDPRPSYEWLEQRVDELEETESELERQRDFWKSCADIWGNAARLHRADALDCVRQLLHSGVNSTTIEVHNLVVHNIDSQNQNAGMCLRDDVTMELQDIAAKVLLAFTDRHSLRHREIVDLGKARITVELLDE